VGRSRCGVRAGGAGLCVKADHGMSMRRECEITCKVREVFLRRFFRGLRGADGETWVDGRGPLQIARSGPGARKQMS
jgi:hypothetical protein